MQSLLDFTPKLWITVWEENVPGFVDRFEEAREADRARLRLVVPGPLLPADVSLLQALQGGAEDGPPDLP